MARRCSCSAARRRLERDRSFQSRVSPMQRACWSWSCAANVHADDILTICWTSGTEGVPKGVPRSHNHWIAGSLCHYDGAQIRRGDRLLNPFPLVNMAALGGCFMSWLRAAGTLLLHHPFELPVYLQQIATEQPEYAIAPPAVLMLLLQNEALLNGVDLSCLRCIGSGSAPLPPVMIRAYKERYGIEIINNFGSNEGVALCSGPARSAGSGSALAIVSALRAAGARLVAAHREDHAHAPGRSGERRRDRRVASARRDADPRAGRIRRLLSPRRRSRRALSPRTAGSAPAICSRSTRAAATTSSSDA